MRLTNFFSGSIEGLQNLRNKLLIHLWYLYFTDNSKSRAYPSSDRSLWQRWQVTSPSENDYIKNLNRNEESKASVKPIKEPGI